jgi:hypothetical protein
MIRSARESFFVETILVTDREDINRLSAQFPRPPIQNQSSATDYYTYKVTAMGTNGWESESSNQPGTYGKPWCPPPCKASNGNNTETTLPAIYALYQNHPNPFNPSTVIHFSLPKSEIVSVKVYFLGVSPITSST